MSTDLKMIPSGLRSRIASFRSLSTSGAPIVATRLGRFLLPATPHRASPILNGPLRNFPGLACRAIPRRSGRQRAIPRLSSPADRCQISPRHCCRCLACHFPPRLAIPGRAMPVLTAPAPPNLTLRLRGTPCLACTTKPSLAESSLPTPLPACLAHSDLTAIDKTDRHLP